MNENINNSFNMFIQSNVCQVIDAYQKKMILHKSNTKKKIK